MGRRQVCTLPVPCDTRRTRQDQSGDGKVDESVPHAHTNAHSHARTTGPGSKVRVMRMEHSSTRPLTMPTVWTDGSGRSTSKEGRFIM